jgi:S-adenosylmethionine decarboxylase
MIDPPAIAGQHWLVEFHGAQRLTDAAFIEQSLRDAALAGHATLLSIQLHQFGGHAGIAGVALLAESHISIHTWPERGYAAIDIFMCGARASPERALEALRGSFRPRSEQVLRHARGCDSMPVA